MNLLRYFFQILSLFSLFTFGRAEALSDQSSSSNPKAPESLIRNLPSRPNILFIAVDQLTGEALSCAGNPYVRTPAIDSLAARGIRFTRSYCTDPVCTPSRASWYTSRMPHEVKIQANPSRDYKVSISNEFPSMGKLFQSNGYETNFSGKWHVPDPFPGLSHRLIPGFNVLPMSELSKEEILSEKGEKEDENAKKGINIDPLTVEAAIQALKKPHTRPFLLSVQILNPHDICGYFENPQSFPPCSPMAPACSNTFAKKQEPEELTKNGKWQMKVQHTENYTEQDWSRYRSAYYHLVEIADEHIGRVLNTLEKEKLTENTLVVFTSDHGEMMGAHQRSAKSLMYEEAVSVPFIIAGPGIPSGLIDSEHFVSGLDILPTFLDAAKIGIPPSLTGKSLLPLIADKTISWRDHLIVEHGRNEPNGKEGGIRMVRTDSFKYIVYAKGDHPEQFFNCEKDPGETNNLIRNPEFKQEIEKLRETLKDYIKETQDDFILPQS